MSIGQLTSFSMIGEKSLRLGWDDGAVAIVDLGEPIAVRKALAPLDNDGEFVRARISEDGWSIEWPCGIDLGASQLRRWANEQSGESMSPKAFRRWMEGHGLTLDDAADALGLSRRTIAYYLSGEQPVSKTVMLATEGLDRRLAA